MRYPLAAFIGLTVAVAAIPASAAKDPGRQKTAAPPIKRLTVKFVSANLETGVVKAKDLKGRPITFHATRKTAVIRKLRVVKGEGFKPRPGESLFIRYWPMKSGQKILQAIMDSWSGTIFVELLKPGRQGKLIKVDFPKRAISVDVKGLGPKRWTLAPNAILLFNLAPARLQGDPKIKPGPKGASPNVFRVGNDVTAILTKGGKVRGLVDTPSHFYLMMAKKRLDKDAAEGPPKPRQP